MQPSFCCTQDEGSAAAPPGASNPGSVVLARSTCLHDGLPIEDGRISYRFEDTIRVGSRIEMLLYSCVSELGGQSCTQKPLYIVAVNPARAL